MAKKSRSEMRLKRRVRIRKKISGTAECPRMAVCKSSKHIYVQFIDDVAGHTLASASTLGADFRKAKLKADLAGAQELGKLAAEKAKAAGIEKAVFDRGGFSFEGRLKAIADSAREAGLQI